MIRIAAAMFVSFIAASLLFAAPAQADEICPADYSCTTEVTEMGTTYAQIYVGPTPTPIVYGEQTTANDYRVQQLEATVARLERTVARKDATIARLRAKLAARR